MSTALTPAVVLPQERALTLQQVALLKRTVAQGTTDDEFSLFLHVCQRTGLDPFARQIYCVVRGRGDKRRAVTQTGIDGLRLTADRSGLYAGSDEPLYDSDTEPHPLWARVTVWKLVQGARYPFVGMARWSEYVQVYYDTQARAEVVGEMWQRMPYLMLGKCAEALALRKAFPAELSGVYTPEELQRTDPEAADIGPLRQQIDQTLQALGKDPEGIRHWWQDVREQYPNRLDAPLLRALHAGLLRRLQAQATPAPTVDPVLDPSAPVAPRDPGFWRAVLEAHADDPRLPQGLRDRLALVTPETLDSVGLDLAEAVLEWLDV